jgi:hypothetical protein
MDGETDGTITGTWRPASARAPVTATLDADLLTLARDDGTEIWHLPLAEVRAVRLVHHTMGGQIMMRLELTQDAEKVRRLEINHPVRGPSEPLKNFTALVVQVLRRVSELCPEVPYSLGESRGISTVMVALGVTLAIMGAGAGAILIAEGSVIEGLAAGAAIFLMGAGIAAANLASSRDTPSRPLAQALDEDAGAG